MNHLFASLFGKGQTADYNQVEAMNEAIRAVGGLLHFTVSKGEDGWTAECDEIDGIMTGGLNPNPSSEEIESNIRDAIHTAFDISAKQMKTQKPIQNVDSVQALYKVEMLTI